MKIKILFLAFILSLKLDASNAFVTLSETENFKNTPTFSNAKKLLAAIYLSNSLFSNDFYCGAPMKKGGNGKIIVENPLKYHRVDLLRQITGVKNQIIKISKDKWKASKKLFTKKGMQTAAKSIAKKIPLLGTSISVLDVGILIGGTISTVTDLRQLAEQIQQARFGLTGEIEWEHIVPASKLSEKLSCSQEYKFSTDNKRTYCQKTSEDFRRMESDLHNLVPAIALLNRDRKDSEYSQQQKSDKKSKYNDLRKCGYKSNNGTFVPRSNVRGWIARTYLYMYKMYDIALTPSELQQYKEWDRRYPPSQKEFKMREIINGIMGSKSQKVMDRILAKHQRLKYAKR